MASITEEFRTYLKTKSAITDVVGSGTSARIFTHIPRQAATKPFILLVVGGGGESHDHLGGIGAKATSPLHVYCCDDTPEEAHTLHELVRLAPTHAFRGVWGSTKVSVDGRLSSEEGYEKEFSGIDKFNFAYKRAVYRVTHDQATS